MLQTIFDFAIPTVGRKTIVGPISCEGWMPPPAACPGMILELATFATGANTQPYDEHGNQRNNDVIVSSGQPVILCGQPFNPNVRTGV